MITITVSDIELYDYSSEEFVMAEGGTFRFEHSLEAISKWEAKWKIPFLNANLTNQQLMDYYKCMCLDSGFTNSHLTPEVVDKLDEYISDPYTATKIQNDDNSPRSSRVMTSEVIYALMVGANVPLECARWNFNRLMVLLQVISESHNPPKKMSKEDVLKQNARLNEERKRKYKTKG